MYQTLRLEQNEGIGILTLSMPEKRNAMTPELTKEFPEAIREVSHTTEMRALIITGTGSVFCAGGDLKMLERMMDQSPDANRREMGEFYRAYLSVLSLDIPTIAAISGHAIGAGMSFTLGCDIRIAAEKSKMGFTYLNLGLHPGMGTTHLLPQVVGSALAADLMLTCRMISANEALSIGLVSRVLPAENLMEEAISIARQLAAKAPASLRLAKRTLAQRKIEGLETALDYEATAQMISYGSSEMRQNMAALKRR